MSRFRVAIAICAIVSTGCVESQAASDGSPRPANSVSIELPAEQMEQQAWLEVADDANTDGVVSVAAGQVLAVRGGPCIAPHVTIVDPVNNNSIQKLFIPEWMPTRGVSSPEEPGGLRLLDIYLPREFGLGPIELLVTCTWSYDVVESGPGSLSLEVIAITYDEPSPETLSLTACFDRADGSERCQTPTIAEPAGTGV